MKKTFIITLAAFLFPVLSSAQEAIDMGLSVKWASCNIGASDPDGEGQLFAWGENSPYYNSSATYFQTGEKWRKGCDNGYVWASYKWCEPVKAPYIDPDTGKVVYYNETTRDVKITKYKYNNREAYNDYCDLAYGYTPQAASRLIKGGVDHETLQSEDDAASVIWGKGWRTPTADEWQELVDNCTIKEKWLKYGKNTYHLVYKFKSKKNGHTITIPTTIVMLGHYAVDGDRDVYYWTSSWTSSDPSEESCAISFGKNVEGTISKAAQPRILGMPIRPVKD